MNDLGDPRFSLGDKINPSILVVPNFDPYPNDVETIFFISSRFFHGSNGKVGAGDPRRLMSRLVEARKTAVQDLAVSENGIWCFPLFSPKSSDKFVPVAPGTLLWW